jgi:hypothetical protein
MYEEFLDVNFNEGKKKDEEEEENGWPWDFSEAFNYIFYHENS